MASDNGGGGQCGEPESSDSLKTFGAVLKALRDEAHLTQEQFAPRVQYSAAYIAKIEQGKRFPPRDLLDRSEEVLGPHGGTGAGGGGQEPDAEGGAGVLVPAVGGH